MDKNNNNLLAILGPTNTGKTYLAFERLISYKSGIFGIYNETKTHILPVAVNSGHYWPKHTFIKYPGHIIIKFFQIQLTLT